MFLGHVEANHPEQANVTVYPLEGAGRGRVRDRQRKFRGEARLVGYRKVAARLTLEPTGTLTTESLEELTARGIVV